LITPDGTIIDGYGRWELARQRGRQTLECIECELTQEEALRWLVQRHRPSNGLNAFLRILLALDLELRLKDKARSNERAGGQKKGSSNLTEAQRLDVRSEIAACAGASVGNVSKVKELMRTAVPELLQALRNGEISIHRAWLWSKESPEKQREALGLHQGKRAIRTEMRSLVRRHRPQRLSPVLSSLFRQLSALDSSKFGPVSVVLIKAPVRAVFLTEELFHELDQQEELIPTCATSSR
jgi:hypothetical protein